jgi:hypothetical protein
VLHYEPKNGWSSLKVLEHITLTSRYLLIIIDKASHKAIQRAAFTPIPQDWDTYELLPKSLEDIGVHRSFSWVRPEHMDPSCKVALAEIRVRMMEQFDRCHQHLLALKNGEGRLCKITMSVNELENWTCINTYTFLYFMQKGIWRNLKKIELSF